MLGDNSKSTYDHLLIFLVSNINIPRIIIIRLHGKISCYIFMAYSRDKVCSRVLRFIGYNNCRNPLAGRLPWGVNGT